MATYKTVKRPNGERALIKYRGVIKRYYSLNLGKFVNYECWYPNIGGVFEELNSAFDQICLRGEEQVLRTCECGGK